MNWTPESLPEPDRLRAGRYRFGVFEVDLHDGELRRSGIRIRIQDQPLQVLAILLSRPGEVITREEFRHLLWTSDTFVDFEHGLNSAVKRLRQVLDDDPDRPRYIETLPRHGYRFIGPPCEIPPFTNSNSLTADDPAKNSPPAGETHVPARSDLAAGRHTRPTLRTVAFSSIVVGLALIAVVGIFQLRKAQTAPQPKVMLAVMPIKELHGSASLHALAEGMTEELTTQLGKAEPDKLGVIARTSMETYGNDAKPVSVIGKELGVQYVLEGSARMDGNLARISIQLIKVRDQTHIWAEEYDRSPDDLFRLQTDIAAKVTNAVLARLLPPDHPHPGNSVLPGAVSR